MMVHCLGWKYSMASWKITWLFQIDLHGRNFPLLMLLFGGDYALEKFNGKKTQRHGRLVQMILLFNVW